MHPGFNVVLIQLDVLKKLDVVKNSTTNLTRLPQSHMGRARHYPHSRKCTHLLHVLDVQCPLQTTPVTQLRVRYIHTTSVPWHIGP